MQGDANAPTKASTFSASVNGEMEGEQRKAGGEELYKTEKELWCHKNSAHILPGGRRGKMKPHIKNEN